ncbi:MAG: hypothetical protein RIQ93_3424 [Verrucomicrobiota bacterium]|jgi:hypothetical protein
MYGSDNQQPSTIMILFPGLSSLPLVAFFSVVVLASSGGAGCSRHDRAQAESKVKDVYEDTKASLATAWDSVKSYTFEQRGDFAAKAKALAAEMEAQGSALRADYSDAKASATRKSAMAELKNSEADYKAKVAALGDASVATWDSAKQNVIASWDRLQASYYKARAE